MSADRKTPVTIDRESNADQTLLVFDGDGVGGVVALERDVDDDTARELAESIRSEVTHTVGDARDERSKAGTTLTGP